MHEIVSEHIVYAINKCAVKGIKVEGGKKKDIELFI